MLSAKDMGLANEAFTPELRRELAYTGAIFQTAVDSKIIAYYIARERREEIVNGLGICRGCFTGQYPLEPPGEDIRGEFER